MDLFAIIARVCKFGIPRTILFGGSKRGVSNRLFKDTATLKVRKVKLMRRENGTKFAMTTSFRRICGLAETKGLTKGWMDNWLPTKSQFGLRLTA